jgi:hypothetical protein
VSVHTQRAVLLAIVLTVTGVVVAQGSKYGTTEQKNAEQARPDADIEIQAKLAKYTRWLVIVGVVQFVALIGQGVVFLLTLRSISDTAQRQLRAYLSVPTTLMKFPKPDVPEVQVHIKNCGQTPAYDVHGWIHMWIEDYPLKVNLPEPPQGFQKSKEVLGPGSVRIFVNARGMPISGRSLSLLGTPLGTIFVYGEVRYKDAFGVQRFTKYRFMYGGTEGVRKSKPDAEGVVTALLKPDTDGNDAN